MTSPTKAELALTVAQLREENEALYGLLAAIGDAAGSAPQSVHQDCQQWHDLAWTRLVQIGTHARAAVNREHPLRILAKVLADRAAEPVTYRVYDAAPPQDPDAAEAAVNARLHDDNREHARDAGTGAAQAEDLAGTPFPGRPGYVTGECGHAVAGSEWSAGFRTCERCPHPAVAAEQAGAEQ